jgi:1-deoxy-D-xylulose-5-phosphate synthase
MKAAELLAAEGISAEVVNMRFVKPLDKDVLADIASRFTVVFTVEDNVVSGGFGSAVTEHFASLPAGRPCVIRHGIPDQFIEHGTPAELSRELLLDAQGIASVVRNALENMAPSLRRFAEPATT